jgi:hypothetical protein
MRLIDETGFTQAGMRGHRASYRRGWLTLNDTVRLLVAGIVHHAAKARVARRPVATR